MKIEVGFPIKSFRFTEGATEEFKKTFKFSAGTVDTLESKIVITNILSNDDRSNLILSYTEDFNPEEGLKYFFERAEKYAHSYLEQLSKSTAISTFAVPV
ncbi:hypothetical protein AB7W88_20365 [Providencia vermicola]|uniref:hypothetical protein n=1 Tax=Providencia TaxID=586 RepID=UPI0022B651C2|nr:hypothetical protein [Providencia sp. 21OH12SH02B-Prov]WBA57902.1 hypothetical protein O7C57_04770 [Providencia sp. 21OH12SH02B-Prov]